MKCNDKSGNKLTSTLSWVLLIHIYSIQHCCQIIFVNNFCQIWTKNRQILTQKSSKKKKNRQCENK